VVIHCKDSSVSISHFPFVKFESFSVKPARTRILVVSERKPEPFELSDLLAVLVSLKVNDMGDAQVLQPLPRQARCLLPLPKATRLGTKKTFTGYLSWVFGNQLFYKRAKYKLTRPEMSHLLVRLHSGFLSEPYQPLQRPMP
jgi:hypothetical protein